MSCTPKVAILADVIIQLENKVFANPDKTSEEEAFITTASTRNNEIRIQRYTGGSGSSQIILRLSQEESE